MHTKGVKNMKKISLFQDQAERIIISQLKLHINIEPENAEKPEKKSEEQ